MRAQLENVQWLVSPDGRRALSEAAALMRKENLVVVTETLRRRLSPPQTHLVIELIQLRTRAKDKFARPEEMFFTDVGLQQATSEDVARYKANRFAPATVADLCCGIGGDLLALAGRAAAVGVECDPLCATLAEANCRALAMTRATVHTGDAASFPLSDFAAVHVDPDRRPEGRRTSQLKYCQPGEPLLTKLLRDVPAGAIKLAPATAVPDAWRGRVELEWISHRGQCRQQVVWFGALARREGIRSATLVGPGGEAMRTLSAGAASLRPSIAATIGRFVMEPDPAVLAAGLTEALANEHSLRRIQPGVAYLTGDAAPHDPALAVFAVEEVMPMDVKKIKACLRRRGIGELEIKKRGIDVDPQNLKRRLRVPGDAAATLLITPAKSGAVAILARRFDVSRVATT